MTAVCKRLVQIFFESKHVSSLNTVHSFLTRFRNVDFDVFALRSFLTRLISNSFQGYVGPVSELRRPQYLATGNPPHRFRLRRYGLGGRSRTNHFKKFAKANFLKWCRGGVWGGLPLSGISVTRALPPQLDVRTVKNLKMSSKGRIDLKI